MFDNPKKIAPCSFQWLLAGLVGTPRQVERFKMNNVQTFQTWPFTRCKRMWKKWPLYRQSWSHTEFVRWLYIYMDILWDERGAILSKPSVNKRQDQIGSIFSAMDILWIYYGHGYGYGYGYLSSRIRWPVRHAQRTVPGGSIRTAIGFRHFLLLMSWSFYVLISWVRNFLCSFRSRMFWDKNQFLRSPLDDWSLSTWEIFQLFPDLILIYSTLWPFLRPH